jgi:uncharacterized protein YdhG (YjbR/CyaY superfamily)
MAKTDFKTVDEYLATQPAEMRAILRRVRQAIQKAVPKAEETISYQIPAYKLEGQRMLYFAGWKEHYSLYPVNERLMAALKVDLTRYKLSQGTIRFPRTEPVPVGLIARIARLRAKEAAQRARKRR